MLGSTLYLVGKEVETGEYVKDAICCSMCKRMVINAGIAFVVVRDDREHYRTIQVNNWVEDDESLRGCLAIEQDTSRNAAPMECWIPYAACVLSA